MGHYDEDFWRWKKLHMAVFTGVLAGWLTGWMAGWLALVLIRQVGWGSAGLYTKFLYVFGLFWITCGLSTEVVCWRGVSSVLYLYSLITSPTALRSMLLKANQQMSIIPNNTSGTQNKKHQTTCYELIGEHMNAWDAIRMLMMMVMIGVLRATFVHMGRATSEGNEAKSKTKQPSDMPTPRFELRW